MTITDRTLRQAVKDGLIQLSGAPLALRRAAVLAELEAAVERQAYHHRKSCDQRFYTHVQRVGSAGGALGPGSARLVRRIAAVLEIKVEDLDYCAIGTNERGFHAPHGDGGQGKKWGC